MANDAKKFLSKILPSDVGGVANAVRFVLGNSTEVVASLDDCNEEIKLQLMLHGLSQKIGDAAAGFSKEKNYHGAFGAMQSVADNLCNGLWASRSGSSTSDLCEAIAELQGVELSEAQAAIDAATEEQLAAFKKHPTVKAKIAEIVAERAKKVAEAGDDKAPDLGEMLKGILG